MISAVDGKVRRFVRGYAHQTHSDVSCARVFGTCNVYICRYVYVCLIEMMYKYAMALWRCLGVEPISRRTGTYREKREATSSVLRPSDVEIVKLIHIPTQRGVDG